MATFEIDNTDSQGTGRVIKGHFRGPEFIELIETIRWAASFMEGGVADENLKPLLRLVNDAEDDLPHLFEDDPEGAEA